MKHTKVYTLTVKVLERKNKELMKEVEENNDLIKMNTNLHNISREEHIKRVLNKHINSACDILVAIEGRSEKDQYPLTTEILGWIKAFWSELKYTNELEELENIESDDEQVNVYNEGSINRCFKEAELDAQFKELDEWNEENGL